MSELTDYGQNWLHISSEAFLPADGSLEVTPLSISVYCEGEMLPPQTQYFSFLRARKPYPNRRICVVSPAGQKRTTDGFLLPCPPLARRITVTTRWHVTGNLDFEGEHTVYAALSERFKATEKPDESFIWSLNPEGWNEYENGGFRSFFCGTPWGSIPRFFPRHVESDYYWPDCWEELSLGSKGEVFSQRDFVSIPPVKTTDYLSYADHFKESLWPVTYFPNLK